MLDHLGDLLRTQVLKKEKELIDKQIKEAEKQTGERRFRIIALVLTDLYFLNECKDKAKKLPFFN